MKNIFQSRLIRWMLFTGFFYLLILSLLRIIFNIVFKPLTDDQLASAFFLGFRYDARVVCIFLFPVLLAGLFFFKPFINGSQRVLFYYSRFFGFLIIFFYTIDFANFAYLHRRLNASILSFTGDFGISASLIWENYPVIKIILLWIAGALFIFYSTRFIYRQSNCPPEYASKKNRVFNYSLCFILFVIAIFGRVGQYPLRWSDAYQLNSDYKANLALNPFQSFFSSLKFSDDGFDLAKAKKYYRLMAKELAVDKPDSVTMNFLRTTKVIDSIPEKKPNIVLVICESFSAYKSSMWGNPLNTTPYFNELCKNGIFFKNCFTPAYGTARGVWATITGIPDVSSFKTASRNPMLVDQQTIFNDINGYNKYYFIGGSTSWANIRGLLEGNIKNLHLYEGDDYKSPRIDVWGISDKNLFLEANNVIKKEQEPFFAIIQTADNHRPFTIPGEDRPFLQMKNFPKDTLHKYGFESNEELNAFVYTDYTFKTFISAAKKEKYFDNTIFVFIGDHGIKGNAGDMFPKVWTEKSLTFWHVPLLFYSPGRLQPQVSERKVSQIDVMPSIAALAGLKVRNTTLGRNIFSDISLTDSISNHTFLLEPDQRLIGLVADKYYYEYDLKTKKEAVYSLLNNTPLNPGEPGAFLLNQLRNLTFGYYETSRFMLFHNKKFNSVR